MTAIAYFNAPADLEPRRVTGKYLEITKKSAKTHERKNRVRHDHLTEEEKKKVSFTLTMSSHYLEGFIDCLDELENLKVLGKEHDLLTVREKLLKALEFFYKEAMRGGEEMEMARVQQQKRIEATIKTLNQMDLNRLDKVIEFVNGLAQPQTVYFQTKGMNPHFCEVGMISFDEPNTIYYLNEPCKIDKNEATIIPEEFVYQKGDHLRVYKRFFKEG